MSKQIHALLGLLLIVGTAQADTTVKQLAPGVTLTQEIDQKTPLVINVVSVDLTAPGVRIGVGVGQDKISGTDATHGREDVSRLARRWGALAAINADFFPYTGDPLGVGIRDGELFSEPFMGIRSGGPRVTLGVAPDGKGIFFENLGFLGDLQTPGGQRAVINGINRPVSKNEMIVYTSLYGPVTGNVAGGVEVLVGGVNLPVRANKLLAGRVRSVRVVEADTEVIPDDGVVLSAGPGAGADFLARTLHLGDPVSFVLAVAPVGQMADVFQVAALPRSGGDLPSRSGLGINRAAWVWGAVPQAVGGGPRLLVGGQVSIDGAAEGFDAGFTSSLNPRTAVGTTRDGHHLLLVTVDGRQAISRGVTLTEMALILKRYGAWDAINLDGGGSTTMAVGGLTVSSPEGGGSERPVADMLLVYSDQAYQPCVPALPAVTGDVEAGQEGALTAAAHLVVPRSPLAVGSAVPLKLQTGDQLLPGSAPGIVWQGPAGGVGFVNQKGYLITLAPGTGTVSALYKGRLLTAAVVVVGKTLPVAAYSVQARLLPDPAGSARSSLLVVRITDAVGKPLANAPITVTVTGGTVATTTLQTDFDGTATVALTWAAEGGGTARVSSGTLTPSTLTQP